MAMLAAPKAVRAEAQPDIVRMSIDETPFIPVLTNALGFFAQERIVIEPVAIQSLAPNDFEFQAPMHDGRIDLAYHWFHHAIFGARHGLPIPAIMTFNDAPGMTVFVAKARAQAIRTAADFAGMSVAAGAGYGTKALVTHTLAARAGLSADAFRLVHTASENREANIMRGIAYGSVDVVTSEEPLTARLRENGQVLPLFDLTTRRAAQAVLGAPWPAQSLLASPVFLRSRPAVAQRAVNAFVRTMEWLQGKSAEEIAYHLPLSYFEGTGREQKLAWIRDTLPTLARGDYSVPVNGAARMAEAIAGYRFDASNSGKWRATQTVGGFNATSLADNRWVERALRS